MKSQRQLKKDSESERQQNEKFEISFDRKHGDDVLGLQGQKKLDGTWKYPKGGKNDPGHEPKIGGGDHPEEIALLFARETAGNKAPALIQNHRQPDQKRHAHSHFE